MINTNEAILWCDVETTGVNFDDELLQVAAILTDERNGRETEPFERVVHHGNPMELRANSVPIVQSMHDETGLWSLLEGGVELSVLDEEFLEFINSHVPANATVRLAGSSCRLDLNFIEKFLPKTYSRLTYRFIDVSGMAFIFKSYGIIQDYMVKEKTHNAIDDIRESMVELEWLLNHVK